jgi:hypothetical protein
MAQNWQCGIDWGTHSSKWSTRAGGRVLVSSLPFSSDLMCDGQHLTLGNEAQGDDGVRGLKGVMILDPLGSPFWEAQRTDTKTPLGHAVSFSLCCLLADAFQQLRTATGQRPKMEVAFSYPNWLTEGGRKTQAAAKNFREAAAVAVWLAATQDPGSLPKPQSKFPIPKWQRMVGNALPWAREQTSSIDLETIMQASFQAPGGETSWAFITESGAAGLPYLRAARPQPVPGCPGLAKLLVVDVGAGSTDTAYMLRVVSREDAHENLYLLPPAASFPLAGNHLTECLMDHQRSVGNPITYSEAEAQKLRATGWHQLPFVQQWVERIARHVEEYVAGVPDQRWLTLPVQLNVFVTGGSGLVPGLKDRIQESVRSALRRRGADAATADLVSTPTGRLPEPRLRNEAEYARRAVSLGASDGDRPGCRYLARMDPPPRSRTAVRGRWV